nr:uncharacterized protein LOC113722544 [Coffea arabica]
MEKAYDRVEWPFLLFILRHFGFAEHVVDIVFRLVSNNWFSVLVNGEAAGFFKSSQGVRQGYPEQMVTRVLGFHRQFFPFTYLGAPIYKGRRRNVLFDGIVAKMQAHLGHWSTKLLSFGGKLVLARHVLASLPMYLLQVVNPPKAVLTRLGSFATPFCGIEWREAHTLVILLDKLCFST